MENVHLSRAEAASATSDYQEVTVGTYSLEKPCVCHGSETMRLYTQQRGRVNKAW